MKNILVIIGALFLGACAANAEGFSVGTNSLKVSAGYVDSTVDVTTASLELSYGLSRGLIGIDALVGTGYGYSDPAHVYGAEAGVRLFTTLGIFRPYFDAFFVASRIDGRNGLGTLTEETWGASLGVEAALSNRLAVLAEVSGIEPDEDTLWTYTGSVNYWLTDSWGALASFSYSEESDARSYRVGLNWKF